MLQLFTLNFSLYTFHFKLEIMSIYLDNAATTYPKPFGVYEKTFQFLKEGAGNPGRGGHYFSTASAEVVEQTRREVARFFSVKDHRRVIFTYNCTDSLNIVLKGYVRAGDHVIATNLDHNSVSRPLESLAARDKISLSRIPFEAGGRIDPERVAGAISDRTTLIVLNHGSNALGAVQDLTRLRTGTVPVLLDAAQTAGRIPIAQHDAPVFIACSAHKSLFGAPGLGLLIVPENVEVQSWREGGSGTASEMLEHPSELPMHLEAGTPNFLSIAALSHSLSFLTGTGIETIHSHEWKLAKTLLDFMEEDEHFTVYSRLEEGDLAIVAFNIRRVPPEEAAAILDQRYGIAARAGLHCAAVLHRQLGTLPEGCIRVSPGYFNTSEDMDALIQALGEIARGYNG